MKHIWSQTKLIKRLDGLNSNELNRRRYVMNFNDIETMVKSKFKDIKSMLKRLRMKLKFVLDI